MLVLYLLAAHLIGDYLIQTRWQSVGKFGWTREAIGFRTRHVLGYLLPFTPVAFAYGNALEATGFLAWLGVVHWYTDAQRIVVTPGEWLWWRVVAANKKAKLEPNPWPSLPLAIDQTLHVIQIAVLGGWFLA